SFSSRLYHNDPFLVGAFAWETVLAVGVVLLAALGVAAGLRAAGQRWPTAGLLLVMAYYLTTIGVVGLDAYMRHRSMLTPLLALLAARSLGGLFRPQPACPPAAQASQTVPLPFGP